MTLESSQTEDLIKRWQALMKNYLEMLEPLNETLIKIDKIRNELLLIREELIKRNIDPEEENKKLGEP